MKTHRTGSGFTLIELLVAVAILALLAVLSWRGLDSILRTRTVLSQELAFARALQTTFNQIEADLRSVARDVGAKTQLYGVQFAAGQMLLLRYQFNSASAGRWQMVLYSISEGQLQRRAIQVNSWADLQRWQNTPQAWQSLEPQNLVSDISRLSWQVVGQPSLIPEESTPAQSLSQAQNMGAPARRLGVQLTLDLNNGARFVRQWGVRE